MMIDERTSRSHTFKGRCQVISYLRVIVIYYSNVKRKLYTKILRKHLHERDLETIGPDLWATGPSPMQWGNLSVPSHLRGGAAATAFFHHICDFIY